MPICTYCGKFFSTGNDLSSHSRLCDKNINKKSCEYCGKNFKGTKGLNIHLRSCDKNTNKELCEYCGKTVLDLVKHNPKCKNNPDNHSTICKYCGASRKDIAKHLNNCDHNPSNGKVCPFCNKVQFHTDLHMNICELNPKNVKINCNFCGIKYKQRTMSVHNRRCSKNPDVINCDICDCLLLRDEYETHKVLCNHNSTLQIEQTRKPSSNNTNIEDKLLTLTNILSELSTKLNYKDMDDMLNDYDMICPVCYEPTNNKTSKCEHPICVACLNKIYLTCDKKCPICRNIL